MTYLLLYTVIHIESLQVRWAWLQILADRIWPQGRSLPTSGTAVASIFPNGIPGSTFRAGIYIQSQYKRSHVLPVAVQVLTTLGQQRTSNKRWQSNWLRASIVRNDWLLVALKKKFIPGDNAAIADFWQLLYYCVGQTTDTKHSKKPRDAVLVNVQQGAAELLFYGNGHP